MLFRTVSHDEMQQAVTLADSTFRKPGDISMGTLFPPLFAPGVSHSYGAFTDEGRLVAFMGLAPSLIRSGSAMLRVFSIGSVCTDPDYRGQGLAGTLLGLCKEHAARARASLLFVSGSRSLYTRAGCVPFGRVYHAELDAQGAEALARPAGWEIRPMDPADLHAVCGLLAQREAGHVTGPGELGMLLGAGAYAGVLRMPQRTLVAVKDGSIAGFAAVAVPDGRAEAPGRAATALEWAGPPEAAAALLARAARDAGAALRAPVPWQERSLLALLRGAGAAVSDGRASGTVCIADRAALLRQAVPGPAGAAAAAWPGGDEELLGQLFDPAHRQGGGASAAAGGGAASGGSTAAGSPGDGIPAAADSGAAPWPQLPLLALPSLAGLCYI